VTQRLRTRGTYMSLEAIARVSGVSVQRLRRYESEGLIVSDRLIEDDGGRRLYEVSVVQRVRRIRSYEVLGVNLPGVEVILRLLDRLEGGRAHRRR
jgi:DNA-binding transcriptional MerR regulator